MPFGLGIKLGTKGRPSTSPPIPFKPQPVPSLFFSDLSWPDKKEGNFQTIGKITQIQVQYDSTKFTLALLRKDGNKVTQTTIDSLVDYTIAHHEALAFKLLSDGSSIQESVIVNDVDKVLPSPKLPIQTHASTADAAVYIYLKKGVTISDIVKVGDTVNTVSLDGTISASSKVNVIIGPEAGLSSLITPYFKVSTQQYQRYTLVMNKNLGTAFGASQLIFSDLEDIDGIYSLPINKFYTPSRVVVEIGRFSALFPSFSRRNVRSLFDGNDFCLLDGDTFCYLQT